MVTVYAPGSSVRLPGGTDTAHVVAVILKPGGAVIYGLEWFDGEELKSVELFDFQLPVDAGTSTQSVGFRIPES